MPSQTVRDLGSAVTSKDEFLAVVGHELRTPLNAIIQLSRAMARGAGGPLLEQGRSWMETITSSATHLLAIVNDIIIVQIELKICNWRAVGIWLACQQRYKPPCGFTAHCITAHCITAPARARDHCNCIMRWFETVMPISNIINAMQCHAMLQAARAGSLPLRQEVVYVGATSATLISNDVNVLPFDAAGCARGITATAS
eukprot:1158977-Pelagomonas_calceolata.AAC.4